MVLAGFTAPILGFGQCDSTSIRMYADTSRIVMIGDSVWPNWKFCPAYDFEFHNDSIAFVYETKEYRHNNRWVMLQNWCWGRTVNWSENSNSDTVEMTAPQLSQKSRTTDFTMASGDTFSLYRRMYWTRHERDSIEWRWIHVSKPFAVAIEVVDSATQQRIRLLDSMSFAPVESGPPCVYLHGLVADRLEYVHPANSNAQTVFVRVHVYQGPSGIGRWYRSDNDETFDSPYVLHSAKAGPILHTVRILDNNACGTQKARISDGDFLVRSGNELVRKVTFSALTVDLYTVDGRHVASTTWNAGSPSIIIDVPNGSYVAVIREGDTIIGTQNIVSLR